MAAWPRLMPPSLQGTWRWRSTVKPDARGQAGHIAQQHDVGEDPTAQGDHTEFGLLAKPLAHRRHPTSEAMMEASSDHGRGPDRQAMVGQRRGDQIGAGKAGPAINTG